MAEQSSSRIPRFLVVLLLLIAAAGIIDLILDAPTRWLTFHTLVELAFVTLGVGSAAYLGLSWFRSERSRAAAETAAAAHRAERDAWRQRAQKVLRGLGEAIDRQLGEWGLTPAEKETALLMLKGYGHKDIARLCSRSERTVRQHAVAVYRKSGLSGRSELAAFFLEDLLLPAETGVGGDAGGR